MPFLGHESVIERPELVTGNYVVRRPNRSPSGCLEIPNQRVRESNHETVSSLVKLRLAHSPGLKSPGRCGRLLIRHRLMKTGGRLVKHARYYWLLLAEGHLNRRLFGDMLHRIWALPLPSG